MRKWMLGLAAVAAAAVAAPAQDKQDKAAVAVVKKAIDAHGGADALNKYKAGVMKMKGTATVMGLDMDFTGTISYALPDKFKLDMDAELMGMKLKVLNVTDGKNVKSTLNGMAVPLPDAAKDELLNNAVEQEVAQLTPLLDAEKFTLKAGDDADVGGKKAAVVVVSGKRLKDKEWKLFFDKDKGTLVKTQRKGLSPDGQNEVDEETLYEDYKKVDGVMTAHKFTVKHDGNKFLSFEVTEVAYKDKLDDKEFSTDD
jgi:hypothetical protein